MNTSILGKVNIKLYGEYKNNLLLDANMKIEYQTGGPEKWQADTLLLLNWENGSQDLIKKFCPWAEAEISLANFRGKKNEICCLYGQTNQALQRVILVGLGKYDAITLDVIRGAIATGVRKAAGLELVSILFPDAVLDNLPGGKERLTEECVYAAILSTYNFTEFKTVKDDIPKIPELFAFGVEKIPENTDAISRGQIEAEAVFMARNLDNMPGNLLYPEAIALHAANLAHEHGFECRILNESEMDEESMGCLLAVGQGSSHPPRLVILEYAPKGHENDNPLIFVGKGITFDSGGLCLKPAKNMFQMKCDMSGAGAVLSVLCAAAREKIGRHIVGILACAENMPDGGAFRPGDILTSASGETVEVINTDAEGRLVLCDALAFAQKQWKPAAIIDIATLTGACAVALGNEIAGLFCDNPRLAERIIAYGKAGGENFWQLPLWQGYAGELKSPVADIRHTGSREGGAIIAALFLKKFIKSCDKWAHLDIAGVDWQSKSEPLCPQGATGFGVRTLLELARGGAE